MMNETQGDSFDFAMIALFLVIGFILMVSGGCATTVTKYEYDDGKAVPVEKIKIRGIGKAKSDGKKYEISSEPWVKIPELPKIELDQ